MADFDLPSPGGFWVPANILILRCVSAVVTPCYNGLNTMDKSDSFPLNVFLEQWLPRLMALGVFGYLAYALFVKQYELSSLHLIALAMAIALLLALMARRLRVPNLIGFDSRLHGLEQQQ